MFWFLVFTQISLTDILFSSLFRLSDETGELKFELIASNSAPKRQLHDDDVYFIDTGSQLFVYIGGRCSMAEKQNAMSYAHVSNRPSSTPKLIH